MLRIEQRSDGRTGGSTPDAETILATMDTAQGERDTSGIVDLLCGSRKHGPQCEEWIASAWINPETGQAEHVTTQGHDGHRMARGARTGGRLAVSVEVPDDRFLAQDYYRWTYRCRGGSRGGCGAIYPVKRELLTKAITAAVALGLGTIDLATLTKG